VTFTKTQMGVAAGHTKLTSAQLPRPPGTIASCIHADADYWPSYT